MLGFRQAFNVVGIMLMILGTAMFVPLTLDLAAGSPDRRAFFWSGMATLFFGSTVFFATRGPLTRMGIREMALLTTTSWVMCSTFAALPFVFSTLKLTYTDAFFETISGFTTTGSTVLTGLDSMSADILLWRGIIQWLGGIGFIVMAMAILPMLGIGGMQLFHMESSDRSEKALPRMRQMTIALGLAYVALSGLCVLGYWLAGMTAFEAVIHAMTTLSTAGYSTSDASLGNFSNAAQVVAIVFMIAGGMPFGFYVWVGTRQRWPQLEEQIKLFLAFLAVVIGAVSGWRWLVGGEQPLDALRLVAFNVVSVVTTTGYTTADYGTWGTFAVLTFLLLMFVGGCTGSTAGGIKMFRFYIMAMFLRVHLKKFLHPHIVLATTYAGRPLAEDVPGSVIAFIGVYLGSVAVLTLALGLVGLDVITSLSGAAQAIANVGPGLGPIIGPAGNYATLPDSAKWLLSAGMLLGRLEFFTVLVVLSPRFWRG